MRHLFSNIPAIMITIIFSLIPQSIEISRPTAIAPDLTYTTGTAQLINSGWGNTSPTNFLVNYQTTMNTASLNGTLGIMGINYHIKGNSWGWRMSIVTLAQSSMNILLNVRTGNNPIFYLRICYFVTYNSLLDASYVTESFSSKCIIIQPARIRWPITPSDRPIALSIVEPLPPLDHTELRLGQEYLPHWQQYK